MKRFWMTAAALVAVSQLSAQAPVALPPLTDVQTIEIQVRRAPMVLGFDTADWKLSIDQETGGQGSLAVDDRISSTQAEAHPRWTIERPSPDRLVLVWSDGAEPRFLLGRTGETRASVHLPAPWAGVLKVDRGSVSTTVQGFRGRSLAVKGHDGDVKLENLDLEADLEVDQGLGAVVVHSSRAARARIQANDARTELTGLVTAEGTWDGRLGSLQAQGLAGRWTLAGQDGRVEASAAPGAGPWMVSSRWGDVVLTLPGKDFHWEASGRTVESNLPLTKVTSGAWLGAAPLYRGGAGAAKATVTSGSGAVRLTAS